MAEGSVAMGRTGDYPEGVLRFATVTVQEESGKHCALGLETHKL